MWGSDYPHTESTFPRSRQILGEVLHGLGADERHQITVANAARLYSFALPDDAGS
jgi:predicted TIM-barrel fold metal-dependent hydrolase